MPSKPSHKPAILGAAFLMATSAIGPGFLTQTALFTEQLQASFGFVILVSILLDIIAQLNIWRVLTVSELHAQDLANKLLPGLGYVLAALIVLGGLAFNIGNIAGCGMGLNVLFGIKTEEAAIISCVIALFVFWMKEVGNILDGFTKVLGMAMILLTLYIAISSHPPIAAAIIKSFVPDKMDTATIITLVGGTVGGYISFAGAHRLLAAGIKGQQQLKQVNKSAVSGIVITGTMRSILFLAALGVVMQHVPLEKSNPAATVFQFAAGNIGYKFFGIVMWSAAITSVVGASYTSVSFIKTFHVSMAKLERWIVSCFIVASTVVFVWIGKPVQLLVAAGALNGLILPVSLGCILLASRKASIMQSYKHPLWLTVTGWLVVLIMGAMCFVSIQKWLGA